MRLHFKPPKNFRNTQFRKLSFRLNWITLGIFVSLAALGCAHDHKVDLNPEVFVRVSNIGKGERLIIHVRDTRSQKAISKKQSGLKVTSGQAINTVSIYASSSIRDTVINKIMEGFERMGFHPSRHGKNSDRRVTVQISKLQMNYQRRSSGIKIPEIHAQMETILQVRADYENRAFNKTYRTRMTKSHRMLTGKFKNERLINSSLSMAIQKMFDDPELLKFLLPGNP